MEPFERITLIQTCANILLDKDWSIMDLFLQNAKLPTSETWNGTKFDYCVEMMRSAEEESLILLQQILSQSNLIEQPEKNCEVAQVIAQLNKQKDVLIRVATGQARIQDENESYQKNHMEITQMLTSYKLINPIRYSDLWEWYSEWKDSLPTYQSRREYIINLYKPVFEAINKITSPDIISDFELTGWQRVDRNYQKVLNALNHASVEEDYQSIGLLCRELHISLAQAVYVPELHSSVDGIVPSSTDSKRMLENYINSRLSGREFEQHRKLLKSTLDLAIALQHKRTANAVDAKLCVEVTTSLKNLLLILSNG